MRSLSVEAQDNSRAVVSAIGNGDTQGAYALLATLTPDELMRVAGLVSAWCALLIARNWEHPARVLNYLRNETGGG